MFNKQIVIENKLPLSIPGPAGRLPRQLGQKDSHLNVSHEKDRKETNDIDIYFQPMTDDFQTSSWQQMCNDFKYLPQKYTISWIKSAAGSNKLINQKAPFLGVVIHNIEISNLKSIKMVLKDFTGYIPGTIVDNVYKEYHKILTVGSVIVLKQLGVLITNSYYCVTITANNLVAIYNHQQSDVNVNVTNVKHYFYEDFLKDINEIKSKHVFTLHKRKSDVIEDYDLSKNFMETIKKNKLRNDLLLHENKSDILQNDSRQMQSKAMKFDKPVTTKCNLQTSQIISKIDLKAYLRKQSISDDNMTKDQSQKNVLQDNANANDLSIDQKENNSSQLIVVTDNLEDSIILNNVFEGINANDLFDDF